MTVRSLLLLGCLLAGAADAGDVDPAPATPAKGDAAALAQPDDLVWRAWAPDLFTTAKAQHRMVLLDLEAVWCHWCHVMDETTYRDEKVKALLRSRFIIVRVDQDSRPDLSNRYEDYGWPATVVFDEQGKELVKRAGYLAPLRMSSMLQALIDDPTPGPSITAPDVLISPVDGELTAQQRADLKNEFRTAYDHDHAGWGFVHKYLDADCLEWSVLRAQGSGGEAGPDVHAMNMARNSLAAARALFDPVWGGVYQYSTGGVWTEPHFEKIMSFQADYLRSYALGYALWGDADDLTAIASITSFLSTFLTSPDGAFYTSQDADLIDGEHSAAFFAKADAGRRALGVPHVDTHIYARENGWAIAALAQVYAVHGDRKALQAAERAAAWIMAHRMLPGGGYRHDAHDAAGPYLGDTVSMAKAALALYGATADRAWLHAAQQSLEFIDKNFAPADLASGQQAGYLTSAAIPGGLAPTPQRDENIALARLANMAFRYTGVPSDRTMATRCMRFLATPGIAERRPAAGVLLADFELAREPLHLTVAGAKDDPGALALFRSAIADPYVYKRVEWFDPREGPLPNADVAIPPQKTAALFICTGERCSAPVRDPALVRAAIDRALSRMEMRQP